MRKSLVFNIQRYSLHDGGGIRTIVFFKGCPLTCPWCSNPESQNFKQEIIRKESLCIHCVSDSIYACEASPETCPTGALSLVGQVMSVDEIIEEVKKDMIFYDSTSGGVTLSGGEPLAQGDFIVELLIRLKELGIHTAIETTGVGDWSLLERAADYLDLFLFDLKIMDQARSLAIVNADIDRIKNNFSKLIAKGAHVIPRVPLIPGFTMDEQNIESITDFVISQTCKEIHILPFHQLGSNKYFSLEKTYPLKDLQPPSDVEIEKIKLTMESKGLRVIVGGQ